MRECHGLYLPVTNTTKCSECGLCARCCPGSEVNFDELNFKIFGQKPKNTLLGNYLQCYVGHSTDEGIRYNSSSGGVVTQLLIYALDTHLIDGALVVRMSKEKPLEPEVFIARTKDEITSSSKSKYCPVSIDAGLAEILRENGRFAVVGLPCHIQGIRKAQLVDKRLSEKIVFIIGLFCARETSFEGTRFFLKSIKAPISAIKQIDYRGKGWPGGMTITFKNGAEKFIPFAEYRTILGSLFFTPQRCFLCCDPLNELADISVGDAWLSKFSNDTYGKSMLISRTKGMEETLKHAILDNTIKLNQLKPQEVISSQRKLLRFKKEELCNRFSVWYFLGKPVPHFGNITCNHSSFVNRLLLSSNAATYYTIITIFSKQGKLSNLFLFCFGLSEKLIIKSLRFQYKASPYWNTKSLV